MSEQTLTTPLVEETVASSLDTEQRLRMSYEEFLAWCDEDTHAEWVDGEVLVFMPPVDKHQAIVGFVYYLLVSFTDLFDLGVIRFAPFEMRVETEQVNASREPDILFIAREHQERLTPERVRGPADLIVEVVSPSSATRDRSEKLAEYEAGGVQEYWVIDPRPHHRQVLCYHLDEHGKYQPIDADAQGRYHSHILPGFWLHPDWLWQEPLPDPLLTLAEIRGLSPAAARTLRQLLIGGEQV